MSDHFLSCDWGTSNFRLRLVAINDLKILAEVSADKGVAGISKAWQEQKAEDEAARFAFYLAVLKEQLAALKEQSNVSFEGFKIVISGMASSTIGLSELPYQKLPIPTDGSGLKTKTFSSSADIPHEILLISGVCSDDDVMRGEETQLIGCLTPEMQKSTAEELVIHPGTHSKHITVKGGRLTGFKTFMTGEFFKLLTTHGILRDNLKANELSDDAISHFSEGVRLSETQPLLHAAFRVRTNDLFGKMSNEENYHFLSGLLIGTELRQLKSETAQMYLCCGPAMHRQYCTALSILGLEQRVEIFPAEWEEQAVVSGQAKILKQG